MSDNLADLLRQDAGEVQPPILDPNGLIAEAEQRLHRRRIIAVLATVAAVAVIALASIVMVDGQRKSLGPVHEPNKHQRTVAPKTRGIVWSDDLDHGRVGTLHVGDRQVEIDQVLHSVLDWSMFVTDTGVVYAQDDGSVWLTAGGPPRRIAAQACVVSAGAHDDLGLATGNAGPLVAWFDCAPASRGDLVVYDTAGGREVARHRITSCEQTIEPSHLPSSGSACTPDALVGQHVYVKRLDRLNDDSQVSDHEFRFDVMSGRVEHAGRKMYLDDLRDQPRTLVVGDTWRSGTPTEATGWRAGLYFRPVGTRLVPVDAGDSMEDDDTRTRVFDTVTGRPVRFRLPSGYQPTPTDVPITFTIFEWLDDDTVALAETGFSVVSDVIVCHLANGHCRLALKDAGIVPGLQLPG